MTLLNGRFPSPRKLANFFIEHIVQIYIGEKTTNELEEIIFGEHQAKLNKALEDAEQHFVRHAPDDDLCVAISNLPLANLPQIKRALSIFFADPSDTTLANELHAQLIVDYPSFSRKRVEIAVDKYIQFLKDELIKADADFRAIVAAFNSEAIRRSIELLVSKIERKHDADTLAEALEMYCKSVLDKNSKFDSFGLPFPEERELKKIRDLSLREWYIPRSIAVDQLRPPTKHKRTSRKQKSLKEVSMGFSSSPHESNELGFAIGEILAKDKRILILGDVGSGKTTLTRWLATILVLRVIHPVESRTLPDTKTIPDGDWIPIYLQCRFFEEYADKPIDEIIDHYLRFSQDVPLRLVEPAKEVLLKKLQDGSAFLIIDGLEEISSTHKRGLFVESIQEIANKNANLPMVLTSRVAAYRNLASHFKDNFVIATLKDFSPDQQDKFARLWCTATERKEEIEQATNELIRAISVPKVREIAGNPLFLTIIALVKHKLLELPERRVDLIRECINALFNRNKRRREPIQPIPAFPQISYLAFCMSAEGTKYISGNSLIEKLWEMRPNYTNVSYTHSPEIFLQMLEEQTSIIIQTRFQSSDAIYGGDFYYEFRHSLFQEFFAALAIYKGYTPLLTLSTIKERVAFLAEAGDKWHEPLRLSIALYDHSDSDELLLQILGVAE